MFTNVANVTKNFYDATQHHKNHAHHADDDVTSCRWCKTHSLVATVFIIVTTTATTKQQKHKQKFKYYQKIKC